VDFVLKKDKSIAVISFGTTYLDTADKTIHAVETEISKNFNDYSITTAYTSSIVRKRLLDLDIQIQSPEECFQHLADEHFKDVIVLPTHIIGGEEYSKVVKCAKEFSNKFDSVKVCRPLINVKDIPHIVDTILEIFVIPDSSFLVFMGHGSNTEANKIYELINKELSNRKVKNIYISTVEAKPDLVHALDTVKQYNPKDVILTPFMLVAGDHANNDMAIEWKSEFEDSGFKTQCLIKGLGEYPQFRKIYVERVKEQLCVEHFMV